MGRLVTQRTKRPTGKPKQKTLWDVLSSKGQHGPPVNQNQKQCGT